MSSFKYTFAITNSSSTKKLFFFFTFSVTGKTYPNGNEQQFTSLKLIMYKLRQNSRGGIPSEIWTFLALTHHFSTCKTCKTILTMNRENNVK